MQPSKKEPDMQDAVDERAIGTYLDALASDQPAPGGGSAAGIVASLAAALAEKVVNLTKDASEEMTAARASLIELRTRALECASDDELAYGYYIETLQMPKSSIEERSARKAAMTAAAEQSARVPIALAVVAIEIINALELVIHEGNTMVLGDANAAIVLAQATVDVCEINVSANLPNIKDEALAADIKESIEAAGEMIVHLAGERRAQINDRLR
jgi:formiminotetrahydrofolate cyclodeaminase